jgi:lysophospholipase L1-like esterase
MTKIEDEMIIIINKNQNLGKRRDAIVFYGSSTFTIWEPDDIDKYLHSYEIINHGFGGSTSEDALKNLDDAVMVLEPKAVFYYEGANDIAQGQTVKKSFNNTLNIYKKLKTQNGNIIWIFLLLHMCPGRKQYHDDYEKLNHLYIQFCNRKQNCHYIDPNEIIYDKEGNIDISIYQSDGIHFNQKGYQRLGEIVKESFDMIFKQDLK